MSRAFSHFLTFQAFSAILQDAMGSFNRIISLFVGLFVIIFVVAFLLGRFKIGSKQAKPKLGGALGKVFNIPQPTNTPTPTPKAQTITIRKTVESAGSAYSQNGMTQKPDAPTLQTIPQTGAGFIIPLIGAFLGAGVYLRRKS